MYFIVKNKRVITIYEKNPVLKSAKHRLNISSLIGSTTESLLIL